jgi:hypothetical protein
MKVVRLSPVDHIFTGPGAYPVQFFLQYSCHLDPDELYKGLKSIAPIFWPVAGQLRKFGDQSYEVVWDGSTPKLDVINCRDRAFPSPSDANALLGLRTTIDSSIGNPLSHFSLYHFDEGSALVANISHCIVDGYSFFYFLSQWAARVKRGPIQNLKSRIFANPIHSRHLLVPKNLGMERLQYTDQEVFKRLGISYSRKSRKQDVKNCVWQFHNFSKEEIKMYQDQDGAQSPGGKRLSSNDIISALIVKKFIAERWFFKGLARVATAFDYRRVLPDLSPRYFGNALRAASFEMSVEQLEKMTEIDIAKQVRRATASINIENSWGSLRYLEMARLKPDGGLRFLQGMRVVDEASGLLFTNISRVSTDQFDFGYGKPTRLIPLTPAERSAVITSQEGGYSVRVSPPHGSFCM